ncbi:MAG: 3-deoxy-manno-octulosonate cytidylyltransferase [Elusimicrobia bacterium]|nr:3-deoxy-manno-octulosonate cytidylyltransferase [Elusimicrobiota bacterium]
MNPKGVIIIPVRWASSRFPGKPLAKIAGQTMLERVWRIARQVKNASAVYIATDDERIASHAKEIGADSVLTGSHCRNGTERVWEAAQKIKFKAGIYLNLQGDAPLTPPWILEALIERLSQDPSCQIATPAIRLTRELYDRIKNSAQNGKAGATTVTFDKTGKALYFSKSLIPHLKKQDSLTPPVYKHLGVYGYTKEALQKWVSLPPGAFEQAEELEQLRVLEHGIPIHVVVVETKGRTLWSVDNPDDVSVVEGILRKEGEICV